jgi:hypothetical protein
MEIGSTSLFIVVQVQVVETVVQVAVGVVDIRDVSQEVRGIRYVGVGI